jgi:hypothetical protein
LSSNGSIWQTLNDGVSSRTYLNPYSIIVGRRYYFRVAARNAAGVGPYTTPISAVQPTVPGTPTGLSANTMMTSEGRPTVRLTWNAPSSGGSPITYYGVEGYHLGFGWIDEGTTTNRSFVIESYQRSCLAYYRVYAVNAVGSGPYTAQIYFPLAQWCGYGY